MSRGGTGVRPSPASALRATTHHNGQNPTPAHVALAGLAMGLCALLTLTGEQLQHLGGAVTVLGGL
ncbi:hypothetical protein ACIBRY_04355 [Streptomyces anulatus]